MKSSEMTLAQLTRAIDREIERRQRRLFRCKHGLPLGLCAVCIAERKAKEDPFDTPYERDKEAA